MSFTMTTEGLKMIGSYIVEEINPVTNEVVSHEEGLNIICKSGADAVATSLTTGTVTTFNYMVISTSVSADARATTAIPANRTVSTVITPTVALTGTTSITTWEFEFSAGGSAVINKFGMESLASGGVCFNEKTFSAVKDNASNKLKVTYNLSVSP